MLPGARVALLQISVPTAQHCIVLHARIMDMLIGCWHQLTYDACKPFSKGCLCSLQCCSASAYQRCASVESYHVISPY